MKLWDELDAEYADTIEAERARRSKRRGLAPRYGATIPKRLYRRAWSVPPRRLALWIRREGT